MLIKLIIHFSISNNTIPQTEKVIKKKGLIWLIVLVVQGQGLTSAGGLPAGRVQRKHKALHGKSRE